MCLHAWVHALTCVWTVAQGQRSIQSKDCLHLCQFHLGNWLITIHGVPVTTAFLFAGRWYTITGGSISDNSYHSQNESMFGLKSACSDQIRQRKCSVFVSFRVSLCHSTLLAFSDVEHVHFRRVVPVFGACLFQCTSRMRLLWYCPIFTVRRITSNTNMLYAKTHFTIKGNI